MPRDNIDHRDYYRVTDCVYIEYHTVPKEQVFGAQRPSPYAVSARFSLLRDMYEVELESNQLLRSLTDLDGTLGAFLSTLNRRLEMMAQILAAEEIPPQQDPAENVTVSEGGISFQVGELLPEGSYLAMKLLFHPSLLGLTLYGEVKYCRPDTDAHYIAGVQFQQMDSFAEQLLSRHIIRLQAEERRKRLVDNAYGEGSASNI